MTIAQLVGLVLGAFTVGAFVGSYLTFKLIQED